MQQRSRYLQLLEERVLVFDGAMGTNIQGNELTAQDYGGKEGCNEYLVLVRPQVIEEIHRGFLEAGCDVLETDSFGGNRLKLAEYGLEERVYEVNYAAARLARRVADEYATPSRPRFVAGSMGPTGKLPSSDDPVLSDITFSELAEVYCEQARALTEGGCDLLLIETSQDILEVRAAILGIRRYFRESGRWLPIQAQVTLDSNGRMLLGTDIAAALTTIESLGVQVVGLNCSTGPEQMREPLRYLAEHSRLKVSVMPNAGIPQNVGGRAVYPLDPDGLASALRTFVQDLGVEVVGGCCGTTHEHLQRVVQALAGTRPRQREVVSGPAISSALRSVALRQDPPPLLVGERVNTQGSRAVKRLLLSEDYDAVLQIARDQVDGGAHALDLCVALTERSDEAAMMRTLVHRIAVSLEAPLMIDSTEPSVIQEALEANPGRAIVNSINLENGRARIDAVVPLVKEHGAVVVALAIDEDGMAKTADRKVEIARRIHDICVGEYGLAPDALIFDPLTFTLATGDAGYADSAAETVNAVRRIKAELPGVLCSLGVSNLSFGLAQHARGPLNSVFLYHAVQAGLDVAIVNPAHITPYAEIPEEPRSLAEDLIFNRRPDALARYIAYFEQHAPAQQEAMSEDPTAGMSVEERIHYRILHRKRDGIEELLDEALKRHTPVELLNDVLLPAMKEVGDRFGAGELILPFVLQSAEVMKRAVAHLERFLERKEGYAKGKVVLATVYGDVHDIGKNLVATILGNNGYTVYDLGKQTPINQIVDKAVEVGADAIGLSALLVSTSKQMPLCVQELDRRGLRIPVIVGGAAINPAFARRALFLEGGRAYEGGVFYAKDAFQGLDLMDRLTDLEGREDFVAGHLERSTQASRRDAELAGLRTAPGRGQVRRSDVSTEVPSPAPPFWGNRVLTSEIDLSEVYDLLDLNTLFRLHWGGKNLHGEDWERHIESDFLPRLQRMRRESMEEGYIRPAAVYGYYPCGSDGDDLVVFHPGDPSRELARFSFPRQPNGDRLCLADYFVPLETGRRDVVAFQLVTAGHAASDLVQRLQQSGDYSRSYYVHGLSVSTAEALAEYVHRRIRRELGLAPDRGKRYSWGYPACPDLQQQERVVELLGAREAIGITLTAAYLLVPEQSTAALVVHHPEARYFSTHPHP
ncbi:MAG: methionine synthase [Sphingomonadaceae bacterium]